MVGARLPTRPTSGDIAVAAAFAVLGASLTLSVVDGGDAVAALALTVSHAAVLAWRRRAPEWVLAAMVATGGAYVLAGWPAVGLGPALVAGVHGLGATRDHQRALPLLAGVVVAMSAAVRVSEAQADTIVGNAAVLVIAWWLGDRQRGAHERAEQAEHASEARAREAVAAERLRIARELHDVVAHALSVIAVQAGTGRVVLDADPETARGALASIEGESRSALGEMRRLLDVLRGDDDGDDPLAPSPGLADLPDLVAATERSGTAVDLHLEGERRPLPAGVDLAAYRIVQEALTNVRRHAGASRAEVRVAWGPASVDVEVLDDGRGTGPNAAGAFPRRVAGNGLVGMRERVALYGGSLDVGDRPGGGFRVAAHLPLEEAP